MSDPAPRARKARGGQPRAREHRTRKQRERKVEEYLREQCARHRFLCLKFTSPGHNGVQDRIVVTPAVTAFVEVKRPGERLRLLQSERGLQLREAGALVRVVDSNTAVDDLVAELLELAAVYEAAGLTVPAETESRSDIADLEYRGKRPQITALPKHARKAG